MGVCCAMRPYLADDESENFIRDSLYRLKIRNIKFSEIHQAYTQTEKIEKKEKENIIEEYHTLEEDKYEILLKIFFYSTEKNSYEKVHTYLAPTYYELWDKDRPQFTFYAYIYSLLNDKLKHQYFDEIVKFYFDEFNLDLFISFIEHYLDINLIIYTNKVINSFTNLKEPVQIDNYHIDDDFVKMLKELSQNVFNSHNVHKLTKLVIAKMHIIVKSDRKLIITKEHIKELYNEIPWLFNIIELRNYFYENHKLI